MHVHIKWYQYAHWLIDNEFEIKKNEINLKEIFLSIPGIGSTHHELHLHRTSSTFCWLYILKKTGT